MKSRRPFLELFRDRSRRWRWRLRHPNGNILASSEAYSRKGKAWESAARVGLHGKFVVREDK